MGAVFRIKGVFEIKEEVSTYICEIRFQLLSSSFPLGLVPDVSVMFFSRTHSGTLGACRGADLTSWELVDFLEIPASDS